MNREEREDAENDEIDITRALAPDTLLASLVDRVNADDSGESGPEVTLIVGGQVIGGRLVSARAWLHGHPDDPKPSVDAASRAWFLHLQDARILNGSGTQGIGDTRARLNEVASWSLHSLSA